MHRDQKKDGFTLIELVIVIAIIVILASISFMSYRMYSMRAKATEAMAEMGHIRTMLVAYKSINDTYLTLATNPPGAVPNDYQPWGNPGGNWDMLGFDSTIVRYQYTGTAGATGDIKTSFLLTAQSDLDGEGPPYDTWTLDSNGARTHTNMYK